MRKIFNFGEDKGMECNIESKDGIVSASCKRTKKVKDKENNETQVYDNQEVNMYADPNNNCDIAYTGDLKVQDNDGFKAFDQMAKKLKSSCQRISKQGLIPKK